METLIYLDTHVVVWLYANGKKFFPRLAMEMINSHELKISPMVRLELQYLYEIKRVSRPSEIVFDELAKSIGLSLCDQAFTTVMMEAEKQSWTRDPFDRIIVAHAAVGDSTLITKDDVIHNHYPKAIWDH